MLSIMTLWHRPRLVKAIKPTFILEIIMIIVQLQRKHIFRANKKIVAIKCCDTLYGVGFVVDARVIHELYTSYISA